MLAEQPLIGISDPPLKVYSTSPAPGIGNAVDGLGGEVSVRCVCIGVDVNAVGQEIHAADVDGDVVVVVQVAFQQLAVPGGGCATAAPDIFAGPDGGGSGGGSVVVVQSLGRGLGVSAELIPMGAGDRFKSGVERIGNGAV